MMSNHQLNAGHSKTNRVASHAAFPAHLAALALTFTLVAGWSADAYGFECSASNSFVVIRSTGGTCAAALAVGDTVDITYRLTNASIIDDGTAGAQNGDQVGAKIQAGSLLEATLAQATSNVGGTQLPGTLTFVDIAGTGCVSNLAGVTCTANGINQVDVNIGQDIALAAGQQVIIATIRAEVTGVVPPPALCGEFFTRGDSAGDLQVTDDPLCDVDTTSGAQGNSGLHAPGGFECSASNSFVLSRSTGGTCPSALALGDTVDITFRLTNASIIDDAAAGAQNGDQVGAKIQANSLFITTLAQATSSFGSTPLPGTLTFVPVGGTGCLSNLAGVTCTANGINQVDLNISQDISLNPSQSVAIATIRAEVTGTVAPPALCGEFFMKTDSVGVVQVIDDVLCDLNTASGGGGSADLHAPECLTDLDCDDANVCTDNLCDSDIGCFFTPIPGCDPTDCEDELARCEARPRCCPQYQTCAVGLDQCEIELGDAQEELAAATADADGDSLPDLYDLCPGTPLGEEIDSDGCSQQQFCSRVDTSNPRGRRTCKKSDWMNDEPLLRGSTRDCVIVSRGFVRGEYECASAQ